MDVSVWLSRGWLYYWWKVNIDHITTDLNRRGLGHRHTVQVSVEGDPFKAALP